MQHGSYRVFDHTADIGLEIRAPAIETLFETAGLALFDLLADVSTVVPAQERSFAITDADPTDLADLLVRWLSELLFVHDVERLLFSRFVVRSLEDGRLVAKALGEPYDPTRHRMRREVKAVTYHQASVSRDDEGWTARVICDV